MSKFLVMTQDKFDVCVEAALGGMPCGAPPVFSQVYVGCFSRYGNDAVQYTEEKAFFSQAEADRYLATHPRREQLLAWGYGRDVRVLEIG